MWNCLPSDLLANIFSLLPPDSLAIASCTCSHWHSCARSYPSLPTKWFHQPSWLLAFPTRNRTLSSCAAYNPRLCHWHQIPLSFLPEPARPIAAIRDLLLLNLTSSTPLQLAICNPFTRQYAPLPRSHTPRTNPAVGVSVLGPTQQTPFPPRFVVYLAGGMSQTPRGGASSYEPTLESYDSRLNSWQILGSMPMELAVRLTVWTPNESVHCDGVMYWLTSARAYSVVGFDIGANAWRELSVPMADRLEFAAMAQRRNGRPILVGGGCGVGACVWELGERDQWVLVERLPVELGVRFCEEKRSWANTKCVGGYGTVWLYTDLCSGMVAWREVEDDDKCRPEWVWVEGCSSVRGTSVQNCPIRGMLLQP